MAIASAATPPGTIAAFFLSDAPGGWLKANGDAVSRTDYADLFAAIGETFGAGDGSTTFNLPDLRGEFLRGHDDGRGVDADRVLGSAQDEGVGVHGHTASTSVASKSAGTPSGTISTAAAHTHSLTTGSGSGTSGSGGLGHTIGTSSTSSTGADGAHAHTFSGSAMAAHNHTATTTVDDSEGGENRPRNVAVTYCIKA